MRLSASASLTAASGEEPVGDGLLTSLPTLADERATYDEQNLTRQDSDENVSPDGWTQALLDAWTDPNVQFGTNIHSSTEGDDLWMALNQYNRYNGINQTEADNWLIRAQNMRDWMVTHLEDQVAEPAPDQNADHLYGWGLAQWITERGPDATALSVLNSIRASLSANTDVFVNETPGVNSPFNQANSGRRWARWLRFSVALTEIDSQAANVTFRDKVIDLILEDPNWDATWGMHWKGEGQTDSRLGAGAYANGDRICNLFQWGLLSDAMWHAWRVLNAEGDSRAILMRQRLVATADFWLQLAIDAGDRLHELDTGRNLNGAVLRSGGSGSGRGQDGPTVNGIYRISPINNLVFAYKFTGVTAYLTEARNLWKDWQAAVLLGVTGTIDHFADTIAPSVNSPQWGNNKGELQYVYALFENGGNPIVVITQLSLDAASLGPGQCRKLQTTLPGSTLTPESSPIIRTASSAVWDPVNREVRFIGKMQVGNPYHFLVYDEVSNTWSLDNYPLPALEQIGHAYDHNTVDPATGDHYFRPYQSLTIQKWNGSSWSALPTIDIGGGNTQVANTISWMPEGLFFFDNHRVVHFDGNDWISFGADPDIQYHTLSEYNGFSDTLIYGGGNGENRMWKLPPSRVIQQIANAPTTLSILGDRVRLCSDPASGGFLLQKGLTNNWWYYDVSADTWTPLTQSTGDGSSPQNGTPNLDGEEYVVATPIDEYGVSLWIQFTSPTTPANVWLYRHA